MKGTERQIAWAMKIVDDRKKAIELYDIVEGKEIIDARLEKLAEIMSANEWIDKRNDSLIDFIMVGSKERLILDVKSNIYYGSFFQFKNGSILRVVEVRGTETFNHFVKVELDKEVETFKNYVQKQTK